MPRGGSGWSRSSLCDLVRASGAQLSPPVPGWGWLVPSVGSAVPLTSEDSFRLLQRLPQPSLGDPPQPDLGVFTRYGTKPGGQWLIPHLVDKPGMLPWGWQTYPQRGAVGQRGPRRGQPLPRRSGWWARPCRADGQAWRAVGESQGVTGTAPAGAVPAAALCCWYLKDGDLAAGGEQGEGDALAVGAEAVALARRGEAEPTQVGEVGVAVQHPPLRMSEAGTGPWHRRGTGECPGCSPPTQGHRACSTARSPKMLCSDFWLGLLAKPLEGPVLAESEVAALLGEASEDGEE